MERPYPLFEEAIQSYIDASDYNWYHEEDPDLTDEDLCDPSWEVFVTDLIN